jgi:manganese/iron transport system ATP-binding protein
LTTSADSVVPTPLVLDDVAAAYGRTVALEGVRGRVEAGESLALIGPNGAGKTTLLKVVLGLLPLAAGHIDVLGARPEEARTHVAYVPQADALDPEFPVSVLDVVLMGRYRSVGWLRRPGRGDRRIALDALDEVGLAARAADRFGMLSGGQRQRVLLARAVAQHARLLLLDEPFNGVDAATIDALLRVLSRCRDDGAAVLLSTHDLAVARVASDHACLLNRRQVAFGPIGEALTAHNLASAYGRAAVLLDAGTAVVTG